MQKHNAKLTHLILTGDFKKKIDEHGTATTSDDTYVMTDGNYTADPNAPDGEANALDLISGTAGNDVIHGLGGDDALSGMAGDDRGGSAAANDANYATQPEWRVAA